MLCKGPIFIRPRLPLAVISVSFLCDVCVNFKYPLNKIIVIGVNTVDSFSIKNSMGATVCISVSKKISYLGYNCNPLV